MFPGWPSPEACLQDCGFDLGRSTNTRTTTIADVHKLKILLNLARDSASKGQYRGVKTSDLHDKLKQMDERDQAAGIAQRRRTRASAAKAMVGFTSSDEFREKLVTSGAVEILCTLLDEDSSAMQVDVMKCLQHLSEGDTNNYVLPAQEILTNVTLWIRNSKPEDVIALHTATSIVAGISRRFDLVYHIEQERMMGLLVETGEMLRKHIFLTKGFDEDKTSVPVFFHQLTDTIKGTIDTRFVTNLASIGLSDQDKRDKALSKAVQEWSRGPKGAPINIPSHVLDPMRMEIVENIEILEIR